MTPESSLYDFRQKLSENPHTQSWLALRRDTGASCFVKCASDNGDLTIKEKHELLRRSFQLQSRVRSSAVLTAGALSQDDGRVYVEYPYLQLDRLSRISTSQLLDASRSLLIRIGVIVDYFHLLGLVHCDLKLENFRLLRHARGERLILVDLDNIRESGDPSDHRIFGTLECIAPEVLNNDLVTGASDLFSLGRSLQMEAEQGDERLTRLIESLTQASPARRPELLLGGLRAAELIDDGQYSDGLKTTLAMHLLTTYRSLAASGALHRCDIQQDLFFAVKLYSIPEEVGAEMQQALKAAPRRAFGAAREMLTEGVCSRCGEYWHLALSDEVLIRVFLRLSGESSLDAAALREAPACRAGAVDAENLPSEFSVRKYLARKTDFAARRAAGGAMTVAELREQAEVAVALQRPAEACEYIRLAIDTATPGSDEHAQLFPFLALQLSNSGRRSEIAPVVEEAMKWVSERSHPAEYLEIKRLMAWLRIEAAEYDEGIAELIDIASKAEELGLPRIHGKALSAIANVTLSAGRFDEAIAAYERALAFIKAQGLEADFPHTFLSYAALNFQIGHYDKAIGLAKIAVKQFVGLKQGHLLLYGCQYLALAHTRLGEYGKADYWIGRCLGLIQESSGSTVFYMYYGLLGWSRMVRGELSEAESAFHRIISVIRPGEFGDGIGGAFKNLAETALYRGDVPECERYIGKAREAFGALYNDIGASELNLAECLLCFYYSGRRDPDTLRAQFTSLMGKRRRYYAALALYVALIESDPSWRAENRELLLSMVAELPRDRTPLFQAVHRLAASYLGDDSPLEALVSDAGQAYRHLEAAGNWFLAMMTCSAIARLHFAARQPRLAARFLRQALAIADRLSNHHMAGEFNQRLREEASLVQERRALVQSFEGIADILAGVGQQIDPLPRLLKFAVGAVEAERGVLLLCGRDTDELKVRAYVGCDAVDLDDVVGFSRSLSRAALASMSPVFMSDAMADDAASKFKSIVAHNIRSVICVPIVVDGAARGVIYLDHHTIPALFDDEDLTFVKALSKFASLIFETYSRLRSSRNEANYLESGLADLGLGSEFVTRNDTVRKLLEPLPQIAASDAAVLIRGESGTGKEIICRMIHAASPRKDGPFVKLNCAAIAPSLVESELFGVADRTATGVGARKGKFETADGGTLFLDEIGDMPLEVQAKVLRVLEYQEFEPVGSNVAVTTDVRFVYATNQDLAEMVRRREFRSDLFYRISGIEIVIPPLRERPDDIEILCRHYIGRFARATRKPIALSGGALEILESYGWPGNVRELRNVIERLSLLHPGQTIKAGDLPGDMVSSAHITEPTSEAARKAEAARIRRALELHDWKVAPAARSLGMPPTTFRRKMKVYGIRRP
jgi:transcriptional regulator with GAF, ATPase, and Fis domain/tetratricopeptide (TPR) repeat protein